MEARGIELYGMSGLNIKSFSFVFFFLLLRYGGLFFLVLFAVVAFPLALSTEPYSNLFDDPKSCTVCKNFQ